MNATMRISTLATLASLACAAPAAAQERATADSPLERATRPAARTAVRAPAATPSPAGLDRTLARGPRAARSMMPNLACSMGLNYYYSPELEEFRIHFSVQNVGNAASDPGFVQVSFKGWDTWIVPPTDIAFPSIPAGGSRTFAPIGTGVPLVTGNIYYADALAVVDPFEAIAESDESNNECSVHLEGGNFF